MRGIHMEKSLKITWEGQEHEVVIGEITWSQKTSAIRKSMKDVMRGRQLKREADGILQRELMLVASIKKAPFEITLDNFNKVSSKDGERMYKIYTELNELVDEEDGEETPGEE